METELVYVQPDPAKDLWVLSSFEQEIIDAACVIFAHDGDEAVDKIIEYLQAKPDDPEIRWVCVTSLTVKSRHEVVPLRIERMDMPVIDPYDKSITAKRLIELLDKYGELKVDKWTKPYAYRFEDLRKRYMYDGIWLTNQGTLVHDMKRVMKTVRAAEVRRLRKPFTKNDLWPVVDEIESIFRSEKAISFHPFYSIDRIKASNIDDRLCVLIPIFEAFYGRGSYRRLKSFKKMCRYWAKQRANLELKKHDFRPGFVKWMDEESKKRGPTSSKLTYRPTPIVKILYQSPE